MTEVDRKILEKIDRSRIFEPKTLYENNVDGDCNLEVAPPKPFLTYLGRNLSKNQKMIPNSKEYSNSNLQNQVDRFQELDMDSDNELHEENVKGSGAPELFEAKKIIFVKFHKISLVIKNFAPEVSKS